MKTPALLLAIITTLSAAAFAQSGPSAHLDLRPGSSDTSNLVPVSRSETRSISGRPESADAGRLEREVFELLNAQRRTKGLKELQWNDEVAAVARIHSRDMADEKFFSHRGSDGSMVDDRADKIGLGSWRTIGENIAFMRGYENPAALAVEKWMESTAHRNNLLGPNWEQSAVGVSITADGRYYLTQVFLLRK